MEGVGVRFLAYNTLMIEKHVETLGWGLGRVTSRLIIHTDLHKPKNKLVSVWLEHFWCTNKSFASTDSYNSPWLELGVNHHLPPYNIFYD